MAVVAGLFNEQIQATQALDILLQSGFEGIETRVVGRGQDDADVGVPVFPVVPNTGGDWDSLAPLLRGGAAFAGADWLDMMDEVERAFYYEGLREGATLVLAKVDDDQTDEVRRVMSSNGARIYTED